MMMSIVVLSPEPLSQADAISAKEDGFVGNRVKRNQQVSNDMPLSAAKYPCRSHQGGLFARITE